MAPFTNVMRLVAVMFELVYAVVLGKWHLLQADRRRAPIIPVELAEENGGSSGVAWRKSQRTRLLDGDFLLIYQSI
jgi:hypothetical protein